MVASPEETLYHLAKQGNLQAIAIFLNQRLASKESQVKLLKPDSGCLQMLLKTPPKATLEPLLKILHQQLLSLRPTSFQTVRIYQPQPGTKTAHLIHKFSFPAEDPKVSHGTTLPQHRFCVGEFLAQVTCIEDLQRLDNHPFVTNKCPQCGNEFGTLATLPLYWDCLSCGWTDDLNRWLGRASGQDGSIQQTIDNQTLANYLVEAGLITKDQVQVALTDHTLNTLGLGRLLVQRGWISETTLEYLVKKVVLPEQGHWLDPSNLKLSRRLVKNLLTTQPSSQHSPPPSEALPLLEAQSERQALDPPPFKSQGLDESLENQPLDAASGTQELDDSRDNQTPDAGLQHQSIDSNPEHQKQDVLAESQALDTLLDKQELELTPEILALDALIGDRTLDGKGNNQKPDAEPDGKGNNQNQNAELENHAATKVTKELALPESHFLHAFEHQEYNERATLVLMTDPDEDEDLWL